MGTRRSVCSRSIGDPPRPVSGSVTLDPSSIKRYAGTAMRWLMLLMSLPPTPTRHRVGVWRKLQRIGAVRLRGSAWILPETPETTELFQWLVQEIQSFRGEATLVHVTRNESTGLDLAISGLVASIEDDHELLERGMAMFEGLYMVLKR